MVRKPRLSFVCDGGEGGEGGDGSEGCEGGDRCEAGEAVSSERSR